MGSRPNPFRGQWKIVSTNVWEPDALDEFGPAHVSFGPDGSGKLNFIAISASIDYRVGTRDGSSIVEFSWAGDDDGSAVCGRGWARRGPEGLTGCLFIHEGDEADFVAKPFTKKPLG